MIDDVDDVSACYDGSTQGEHDRLQRHQLEQDFTWRYLDEYLPSSGSILEIGAAAALMTAVFDN